MSTVVSANVPANKGESPAPTNDASSYPQPFSGQETPATSAKALTDNPEILSVSNVLHVDPTPVNVSPRVNVDVAQPSISAPQPDLDHTPYNDVAMRDSIFEATRSNIPRNDDDLPTWLDPMVGYLRSVAEDTAWQDLVTEFFEFEKSKPPAGVSFHFC